MTAVQDAEKAIVEEVEKTFIRFADIARECGVPKSKPFTWANYHGYFRRVVIFGVNVAPRAEYEKFLREHPEAIRAKESVAQKEVVAT